MLTETILTNEVDSLFDSVANSSFLPLGYNTPMPDLIVEE